MTDEFKTEQIRTNHPYGFRCGEWATLKAVVPGNDRDCYLVEFADGVTDFWVLQDPHGEYEFRNSNSDSRNE